MHENMLCAARADKYFMPVCFEFEINEMLLVSKDSSYNLKKAEEKTQNTTMKTTEEEAYYNQNANGTEFFFSSFPADENNDSEKRIVNREEDKD